MAINKKFAAAGQINAASKKASEGRLEGILAFFHEPLVSSDFRGNSTSSALEGLSTVVLEEKIAKIFASHDNQWGYSCRVADLAALMAKKGL